jgi:ankyrin repeat protein
MKILRTVVLVGLAVSWGQAGWTLKNTAEEFRKQALLLSTETGRKQEKPQHPAAKPITNDLFEAAKHGNAAVVKYCLLLNPQANIEMPLTFAAMHGYLNVLEALTSTIQITQDQYLQALCTAAQYGQIDIVRKVLPNFKRESGVKRFFEVLFTEPKLPSTQPVTPLMDACRYAHPQIVSELLQSDEKNTINYRDSTGMTALIWTCKTMYKMPDPMAMAEIVSELINAGAKFNTQDNTGWTALMYAVGRNSLGAVVEFLNTKDINVNAKSKEGSTALKIAQALTSTLNGELAKTENTKIINLLENAASK